MGCRQSKQSSVPLNLPPSSSDWLAQIGLQQYSAAFYAAGYGDTDTLAGLSRKHINEISLFQKGGIPSPHIKLLLDASKQFCHGYHSSSQQSQLVQQNSSAKPAQPLGTHGNVQYQPALQTPATGRLHGTELADTVSSYTSAGSFDSGYDTEDTATQSSLYSTAQLAQSTTSGLEASTNTRDQSLVARRSTAGNGPSQQHLQQLYAEVQEDYKRLQQLHPASGRLRADIRSPAPPPKRSGLSHAGHLQSAVLVKHAKKGPVQAASSGHVSKAVGEGSAAQMVKQMRKSKSAQRDEPFVHVYTNFHTLSKEGIPPAAASATDAHTLQVASGPPAAHQLPPSETLYSTNSAADQCRVNLPQVSHSQQAAALQSASAKLQDSTNRQLQHSSPSRHQQDTAQLGHPTSSSDAQIYTAQRQHHTGGESQKHQQQRDWSIPSHGQSTPQQQQQPQKSSLMPLQQQKQAGCDDGHDDGQIAAVHWHGPVAASGQQQEASMLLPSQLDQELYLQQPQSLFPHQQSTAPMQASQRTYQPGHLGPMTPQQHLQPFCDMPGVALQPSNQSMQLSFHVGSPSDRQQAASNSAVPVMQQPGVFSNSALPNQQPGSIVTQQLWSSSASMTYQPQAGPAQHQSQAYQAASVAQQHPNQPAAVMQQFVQRQSGWQVPPSQDSNIQFGATTASGFAISGQQQQQFAEQTVRRDAQGNSSAVTYSRSSSSHEFTFRTSRPPSNIPSPGVSIHAPQSDGGAASAAAAEALRVIKMAKLHRHGPPSRLIMPGQHHMVQNQMQQMDAQIRQRVQYLHERAR